MNWWQEWLDRTSWLELVAAFLSVLISVVVALKIQDRDFKKRTGEALEAERARVLDVTQERRRALIERTFDLLSGIQAYGDGENFADTKARRLARADLRNRIDKTAALFALEPNREGLDFGPRLKNWMHELLNPRPEGRLNGDREQIDSLVAFLVEWGRGEMALSESTLGPVPPHRRSNSAARV
ncbi:hypothetical protein ASF48_13465 [Rathayibacter sp. Leaf299]|uniref:hypothetical protein n=1 Tax=Rathayibacter sp. Leaf299 TaxID=1736328 RepID=UPI0006F6EFF4|nr:hypothetical protein [Rathayibacter sp. Leaf299]KQQ19908.1 hypothetical protein ASF48_13465 [Rathayibacter sp. Leaf299]